MPAAFLSCSGWGLHGSCVSTAPVSSYLTISTLPRHYPFRRNVSVALSLQLPAADVIRHPCPAEPGLSSCISTRSPGLPKTLLYYIPVHLEFKSKRYSRSLPNCSNSASWSFPLFFRLSISSFMLEIFHSMRFFASSGSAPVRLSGYFHRISSSG